MIAAFLTGPRDPVRLDTFRMATGVALASYTAAWWLDDALEWLTVDGFHLSPAAAGPGWLAAPPLPVWALAPFGVLFFGTLLALAMGYRPRWAAAAALLCLLYVTHVDPLAAFTPNSLFLVSLAVLAASPQGGYWTLERAAPRPVSVWPVRVLQATLLIVYFTAGTCKAFRGGWLTDSLVLHSAVQGPYQTEVGTWLVRHLPGAAWAVMQSLSLAFELAAPLLFTVRRLRPAGYVWGASMHAGIGISMNEFAHFGLQMTTFYLLFMDDATLHGLRRRLARLGGRPAAAAPAAPR